MRWVSLLLLAPLLAGCAEVQQVPAGIAISATHPLAVEAGAAVLAAGGNAFDAAAAIQFTLNVVEPGMSGIGGGAFFVGYLAQTGEFLVLDGRETAPAALAPDAFAQDGPPAVARGTAVGVPGTLALWEEVLARVGTTGLAAAMAPGLALARAGFAVDAHLARYIEAEAWKLRSWPASAQLLFPGAACLSTQAGFEQAPELPRCVGGQPLRVGDILVQPELGRTYETIMAGGTDVFYEGPIAQAVVAAVAERNGVMTAADLAAYRVEQRKPVRIAWDDHEVVTFPAPGGGVVVAQALAILEPFDLQAMPAADRVHVLAETMSLVYADRGRYVADPAFVSQPPLLAPDYIEERRALIDLDHTKPMAPGDPWSAVDPSDPESSPLRATGPAWESAAATAPVAYEGDHTTHFVVVDAEGNIASVTSTIESVFGTGMLVDGFFLNNEMTDFSTDPEAANAPAGGKRARSSMSPTIVLRDGGPVMALGASGGPRIITATLQVILNTLALDMPVEQAVRAPRIHSPDSPGLMHEGMDDATAAALRARGHEIAGYPGHVGNVQAVLRTPDGWAAAADTRAAQGACTC